MRLQSIGAKLFYVCVSFALPIAVMSTLMTQAKQKDIDFATWEKKGNQYQRPLEKLFKDVSFHRWISSQKSGGNKIGPNIQELRTNIANLINEIQAVDQKLGVDLQFTTEGLGKRQRTEFTAKNLESRWKKLLDKLASGSPEDIDTAHKDVINHIKTMITHAGDTSNLILDPDLDSYYLMDVTLLALPQTQDRLQEIAAFIEKLRPGEKIAVENQLQARVFAAFLSEADRDRITASSQTALNEDANFYGTSISLQTNLRKGITDIGPVLTAVVDGLNAIGKSDVAQEKDLTKFRSALEKAINTTYDFHFMAFDELDTLLTVRIRDFESGVYNSFIWSGLASLVAAVLAFGIALSLVRRVRKFIATTKVIASGDLKARVGMTGGDELTELADSFDAMTSKIDVLNQEIAAKNDDLKKINTNLEQIVEARTAQIKTILDNVKSGLLMVGPNLKIQEGFSRSCYDLFGKSFAKDVDVLAAFGLTKDRNAPMWREFLSQAFEDFLPEEMTIHQFPARFPFGDKVLALSAKIVRDASAKINGILFTVFDATDLEKAERESKHQQLLVRLLRESEAFRDFIDETKTRINLCRKFLRGNEQGKIRAELHTIKGNTGAFDLLEIAKLVHNIEDAPQIVLNDINAIEAAFRSFLDATFDVLQMSYDDNNDDSYTVSHDQLENLVARLKNSDANKVVVDEIQSLIIDLKSKSARSLVGALPDYASRLATRLCKQVEVKVEGGEVRMNPELMRPVMQSLVHLVRNSIDHGIENPDDRKNKGDMGHITIKCTETPTHWSVEVFDDGRGIDTERVIKKAIASGAISQDKIDKMTDAEKWRLIFFNGVSTASTVSDISGRGIGMGAVEAAVREAGGTLDVESQKDQGTNVKIQVPKVKGDLPRLRVVGE